MIIKMLAAYADEIIIMAYDYSYEAGPEPLTRINEAIQLAMKEFRRISLCLVFRWEVKPHSPSTAKSD